MANFGKRPINDANEYKKRTSSVFYHDGEQRIDRRPYGFCERFVDGVGNVITLQLATPGDPRAQETILRIRAEKHNDGWIEHAKCPLRHGLDQVTPAVSREFARMPADMRQRCESDPKVMSRKNGELHAEYGCKHIEWLIKDRIAREAEQNAKRNSSRVAEEKRKAEAVALQEAQLEMVKEQLAERKARKTKSKDIEG